MSDVLEVRVKKSHVAVLSVVILVASASAAVNVRDPMNVFGNLDMQNNVINNPKDIKFGGGTVTKEVDINTDGKFNTSDALALAFAEPEKKVDFNRDGEKDFDDAIAMAYAVGTQRSFDPDTGEATFPKYSSLGRFNSLSTALSWYTLNPNIKQQGTKNVSIRSDLDLQGNNIYNAGNLNTGNGGDGEGSGDRYLPEKPATQNVDMNDHKIRNLAEPVTDSEAATKGYVDAQTGSGGGGGSTSNTAPALDWSNARPVKNTVDDGRAKIECNPGEVLRDVTCFTDFPAGGTAGRIEKCDTRTENSASEQNLGTGSVGSVTSGVSGTCVPVKTAKKQIFSNQNSSNTFQVPSGTSRVEYKVYGGVGGGSGDNSGGSGGYVEGSIPVDGETTLNVYVGQNGGTTAKDGTASTGRGGCVPFEGVKCGGDGGDGYIADTEDGDTIPYEGGGGGGAPTMIADSSNQVMVAAGGGAGGTGTNGGGGGAGGGNGEEEQSAIAVEPGNDGQDADTTPQNLGGDAEIFDPGSGGTFVHDDLPAADSTGTSDEGAKAELAAFP